MKALVIGDAGCHSGFATVVHNIFERLQADYDWDVSVLAVNHQGDYWPTTLKLYPANLKEQRDIQGFSRYVEMLGTVRPDVIVFVNDPHVVLAGLLDNRYDSERVLWGGLNVGGAVYQPPLVAYMPIDGYESPRSWDLLKHRVTRVAMTHFGQATMPEAPVVWHGVDTSLYHPRDKREAKEAIGYDPDRFLILRVDKNSTRKDYPATWKALRPLLRKYGDIDVHFHCLPRAFDGNDLNATRFNDEDIRDRVRFPNINGFVGWDEERLATLFAAADLFVSTSWGEGFGLGLLQAIASGTPVVAQNCSAITEVVGPGGVLIDPAGRIGVPMGQEQCLPDIPAFTEAIEKLYLGRGSRRKLADAGVRHAAQFSWAVAARKFDKIMREAIEPKENPPVETDGSILASSVPG